MDSNKFALFALRKDVCDPFVRLAMKASLTHGGVRSNELALFEETERRCSGCLTGDSAPTS
jgi:hypothetical protein